MGRAAGFMQQGGYVFGALFGNQAPEVCTGAFRARRAAAHGRLERESNRTAGFYCGRQADAAGAAAGNDEHLIWPRGSAKVQRADDGTEAQGNPIDTRRFLALGIGQIQTILISEQPIGRGSTRAFERARAQNAFAAVAQIEIILRVFDAHRTRRVEYAVDGRRGHVHDSQWGSFRDQRSNENEQCE